MLLQQLGAQSGGARPATPPGEGQGGALGESGTQYQKAQIASETREGVVLVIAHDSASDAFIGTVRNTNNRTVQHVRVEVHLSNAVELGPTPRVDLATGETRTVNLSAESQSFTGFSVHVELGLGEHGGSGGEGGGEGNEGGSGEGSAGGWEGGGEHGSGGESREGGGEHGGGGEGREGGGNQRAAAISGGPACLNCRVSTVDCQQIRRQGPATRSLPAAARGPAFAVRWVL